MDYRFLTVETPKDLQKGMDFVISQNLGYPGYHDWGERTRIEIEARKKDMLLITYQNHVIGDFIGQPHKSLGNLGVYEGKNLRIHPEWRGRDLSRPVLRHVEIGARNAGFQAIMLDFRSDQTEIGNFLYAFGYRPVATLPLYGDEMTDVVMVKFLNPTSADLIKGLSKRIITFSELQAAHN